MTNDLKTFGLFDKHHQPGSLPSRPRPQKPPRPGPGLFLPGLPRLKVWLPRQGTSTPGPGPERPLRNPDSRRVAPPPLGGVGSRSGLPPHGNPSRDMGTVIGPPTRPSRRASDPGWGPGMLARTRLGDLWALRSQLGATWSLPEPRAWLAG